MQVKQVTNANVYVGGNNCVGQASECKLPEIAMKMNERKGLGMIGTLELPGGIDKLSAEIKWNAFYRDTFLQYANPYKAVALQVRSSVESWNAVEGVFEEQSLVTFLTGTCKKFPLGEHKPQDASEYPTEFSVMYLKQVCAGVDVIEIDLINNIFKIAGKDVKPEFRNNLGL
ncbi:phage major tail tube protein [Deefgea piscis]|uniref:phage major tail tube protein n=1 Tax=Deefgea piscis TaxID=2739061 RepID=UPI001C7EB58B|nr:phage major tail tube protein [Deefgea piscis]QZA80235.1 phage major tail tube protein [Deefgea piscis]